MFQEGQNAVADQVDRRLVARNEKQEDHGEELVFAQPKKTSSAKPKIVAAASRHAVPGLRPIGKEVEPDVPANAAVVAISSQLSVTVLNPQMTSSTDAIIDDEVNADSNQSTADRQPGQNDASQTLSVVFGTALVVSGGHHFGLWQKDRSQGQAIPGWFGAQRPVKRKK